jgi:hypothetical protein
MIDGIGNGSSRADIRELTQAFDARGVHVKVDLGNEDHVNLFDVRVHRDEIIGEIIVYVSGALSIDFRRFMESGANAPDHPAHELTARKETRPPMIRANHRLASLFRHFC